MKNKILGIFICTLLIATAVPAVTSLKNNTINSTILSHHLTSMDTNWTEIQKILASDGEMGDGFGCFVSLSADTALIGAFWDDDNGVDSGSAYIFTHNGTTWTQQTKLLASDGAAGDNFGSFVSLDGDTALIGAFYDDSYTGSAYVFTRTGTTWTQQQKLLASDGAAGDWFGRCVSLSDDTALIGAPNNGAGSAYVFTRNSTTWTQQAKLNASDGAAGDWFGHVAVDGDTALIGAFNDDDNGQDAGSAYIFTRNGTTWTQQTKLLAFDGGEGDYFGWSVFIRGDTGIVGAGEIGHDTGSAYVFTRNGTTWTQQAKLRPSDGAGGDHFGVTVSISGDFALIGAPYHMGTGSAYVFIRTGTTWTQHAILFPSEGGGGDYWFGYSASIDGNTALVNSPFYNGTGSAYIFVRGNQQPIADFTWTPANPAPGQTIIFDASGSSDPDGNITTYEWDWNNDGSYDESHSYPIATHSWSQVGNYPITLRITDDDNATDTDTKIVTVVNQPPNKPTINGPTSGKPKIAYQWNFTSIDADNDDLFYQIDWGDGALSPWYGPHDSGWPMNQSHAYDYEGTYTIKAIAKDVYDHFSEWGTLSVIMPRSYNIPLIHIWEKLLERFPHAFPIMKHLLKPQT